MAGKCHYGPAEGCIERSLGPVPDFSETGRAGCCSYGHDFSRIVGQTGDTENGLWAISAISCDFAQGGTPKPQDQPQIPGRGSPARIQGARGDAGDGEPRGCHSLGVFKSCACTIHRQ